MKTKNFLSQSGGKPDVTRRQNRNRLGSVISRLSLGSIVSRFSLASLICLCMLTVGSGNAWGAGAITVTSSAITLPNGSTTVGKGAWMSATGESQGYWSKDVTVGSYGTITCSNAGDQNSTDYLLQLKASGGYIQTTINSPAGVDITIGLKKGSSGTLTVSLTGATNKTYTSTSWGALSISTTSTSATLKVTKTGSNAAGISYITITPKAAASCTTKPTVGSSLTSVSATVNSITATVPISAIGGCNITENGLVYSTSVATPTVGAANCTKVTTTACGASASNKTVTISDLTCNQSYYVRGYATNAAGTSYTNVTTQSTSACPLYTVTLMDDSDTRTQASYGASVTLPSRAGCSGYTFAGWTKTWVTAQTSWTATAPTIIPAGSYTPSANENLYPVYTKTEGGGTAFDSYEKVTSAPDDWTAHKYVIATADNGVVLTGYAANYYGGYTTMSTSTEMASYEITVTEVSAGIYKLYQNSKYLALNANENRLYFLDSYTGSNGTNNKCDWKFYNYSGGYIVESPLTYTISKTSGCYRAIQYNNTSGQERFACYKHNTQTIAYLYMRKETSGSTTYYISVPNCCDNIVAAPTVSATDIHYNQFTLSWTNVTGATGYTVTCASGTVGSVESSGTTRTCTITALPSPNTSYSWTVVATYSGSYCGATPAAGSTTTAQVYAVTYNANGGTVTTLPASASYEAGVTVTVAAKPATTTKSGCMFTGWNTQNDGQGTHYDADGTKTFTMPSAAVTLYAEWTKKKNYYVDRMHGTNDGHTVTIGGVVYNCYLREGANYTVPNIVDNTSGASACHSEHDHLLFWVTASSVNADGTLKNSYTEVTPGDTKTATTDGTVYYAIWGKLAD